MKEIRDKYYQKKASISSSKEVTLEDILNRIYEILNGGYQ